MCMCVCVCVKECVRVGGYGGIQTCTQTLVGVIADVRVCVCMCGGCGVGVRGMCVYVCICVYMCVYVCIYM